MVGFRYVCRCAAALEAVGIDCDILQESLSEIFTHWSSKSGIFELSQTWRLMVTDWQQ